jgi:hypothetical protein
MKEKGQLESVVLSDCLKVLRAFGAFCWRQNTGAFKVDNRFFRSSIAGVSDILGVLPNGRFIAVECKREHGGRVSAKQKEFLQNIERCGGLAIVAHSARELLEKLEINALKKND